MKDYYKVLGLPRDATKAEIRKRYYKLSKKLHPDAGGNADEFRDIAVAYMVLSDDEKRQRYDRGESVDDTADNLRSKVVSQLMDLMTGLLDNSDVRTTNIIKAMRLELRAGIAFLGRNSERVQDRLDKVVEARSRVDNATDILSLALQNIENALRGKKAEIDRDAAALEEVLLSIKDVDYRVDGVRKGYEGVSTEAFYETFDPVLSDKKE